MEEVLSLLLSNLPETSCLVLDTKHVYRLLQNTLCFSTIIQMSHFFLSKQNSLSQPMTCVPSWKTRAEVMTARLVSNATCTSRQTALGVTGCQTAGKFKTSERAASVSESRRSVTSKYRLQRDNCMVIVLLF